MQMSQQNKQKNIKSHVNKNWKFSVTLACFNNSSNIIKINILYF